MLKWAVAHTHKDELQSYLRRLEEDFAEPDVDDPIGVTARIKPGPKGLRGGIALPLPEADSTTCCVAHFGEH